VEIDKDAKIVEISDFAWTGGMARNVAKKTEVVGNGEGRRIGGGDRGDSVVVA
jgi:hypothetical protein